MSELVETSRLAGLLAKKEAEVRALTQQRDDLAGELRDARVFVRLCAAIFPALDGCRSAHAALLDRAKSQPLSIPLP